MKNFKKLFATIFCLATIVFGALVLFGHIKAELFKDFASLKSDDPAIRNVAIVLLAYLVTDILIIALPIIALVLLLTDKFDPFKAITDSALVILIKFLFDMMLLVIIFSAAGIQIDWKEYFFGKDSMAFIPLLVFTAAIVVLFIAKFSNLEGTLARAVFATIGSGLAIFGLVFYFILGKGGDVFITMNSSLAPNWTPSWVTIMGLVVGIACFAGLVVYSYLPQTREFNVGGEKEPEAKVESEPKEE